MKWMNNLNLGNTLLENLPTGIIIINKNGIIEYVNSEVSKAINFTDIIGENIFNFNKIINSELHSAILSAFNGKRTELKHTIYLEHNTNPIKHLNLTILPYDFIKNNSTKISIILNDVTKEFILNEKKEKVETNYLNTIEALAHLIDIRDSYTWQHSQNVSKYASMICDRLKLPQYEREIILLSAKFHDIGKVGISDFILNKTGRLTTEEFEIMKNHSIIGADIIAKIEELEDVSKIIRHHHERWDGTGYPDKLVGDEIPFGSQIIAIADTYDAVTSNRVYRKSLGKKRAIEILREEKFKQFNGFLVDVFLKVIDIEDSTS